MEELFLEIHIFLKFSQKIFFRSIQMVYQTELILIQYYYRSKSVFC